MNTDHIQVHATRYSACVLPPTSANFTLCQIHAEYDPATGSWYVHSAFHGWRKDGSTTDHPTTGDRWESTEEAIAFLKQNAPYVILNRRYAHQYLELERSGLTFAEWARDAPLVT